MKKTLGNVETRHSSQAGLPNKLTGCSPCLNLLIWYHLRCSVKLKRSTASTEFPGNIYGTIYQNWFSGGENEL